MIHPPPHTSSKDPPHYIPVNTQPNPWFQACIYIRYVFIFQGFYYLTTTGFTLMLLAFLTYKMFACGWLWQNVKLIFRTSNKFRLDKCTNKKFKPPILILGYSSGGDISQSAFPLHTPGKKQLWVQRCWNSIFILCPVKRFSAKWNFNLHHFQRDAFDHRRFRIFGDWHNQTKLRLLSCREL